MADSAPFPLTSETPCQFARLSQTPFRQQYIQSGNVLSLCQIGNSFARLAFQSIRQTGKRGMTEGGKHATPPITTRARGMGLIIIADMRTQDRVSRRVFSRKGCAMGVKRGSSRRDTV